MLTNTQGIHHITAIVGDPNENIHFYQNILGLRMIKTTVNFDDPTTYHFYFGDQVGTPGTIITFFPMLNGLKGSIGGGQVGTTYYAIPKGAMSFWKNRLSQHGIQTKEVIYFNETHLEFDDVHGLHLSLVETDQLEASYESGAISKQHAIIGFYGAMLYSTTFKDTIVLVDQVFDLKHVDETEDVIRYRSPSEIGSIIDIKKENLTRGSMGIGTVHHIAMRARDDEHHVEIMNHIRTNEYMTTKIIDRNYFHSIYFREYGDILFEVATDNPGFLIDEEIETLGTTLKLPKQYEPFRSQIEVALPKLQVKR